MPSSPSAERPLVSRSTILILSGFLIGLGAGNVARPDLLWLAGLGGVVAWVGLAHLAQRQKRFAAVLADERAVSKLENRIDRHVPRLAPHRLRTANRRPDASCQYLTVVRASRLSRRPS